MSEQITTMRNLKKLAAKHNCVAYDDADSSTIWIDCNDGYSFDEGERSCNCHTYGQGASHKKDWKTAAIMEAAQRLEISPPQPIPYKYND